MEEKLVQKLKIDKVRDMKTPTLLLHETDFEKIKTYLETHCLNVGDELMFGGIPIEISDIVEEGGCIIYDKIF